MTGPVQCDNCGAVLLTEDHFCGECGAPRPSVIPSSEPTAAQPPTAAPPPPRPARPTSSPETAWRVAAIVLGFVGASLCLLGMAVFLLFGLTDSDIASAEDNWLYSAFCCLLPIAGSGILLAASAAGIWLTRLRNR